MGDDKEIHYITALNGVIGAFTIHEKGYEEFNYILKDHLGSIHCVCDEQGNLIEELSFDAWGKRRNPVNWTDEDVPGTYKFDRGFTMHEHLDNFKLINMNGRMYDPIIARFLSADPIGLEASSSATLNRYGYVNNNPLNATDPSGYYRRGNSSSWGVSGAGDGIGDYTNWDYFDRSWYHGSYMAGQDARFEAQGAINSGNVKKENWSWYSNILYEQYGLSIKMPAKTVYNPSGEKKQEKEVSDEQVGEVLASGEDTFSDGDCCSAGFDGDDPELQDEKNVPSIEWLEEKASEVIIAEKIKMDRWYAGGAGPTNFDFNYPGYKNSFTKERGREAVDEFIKLKIGDQVFDAWIRYGPSDNKTRNIVTDVVPSGKASFYGENHKGWYQLRLSSWVFGNPQNHVGTIYVDKNGYNAYFNFTGDIIF